MTKTNSDRILPAEWEDYDTVLMSWPHQDTDWSYMLDEVRVTFREIVRTLASDGLRVVVVTPCVEESRDYIGHDIDGSVIYFKVETNDTWTRDYGVITCRDNNGNKVLCDFAFNGWGLKFAADKDNLVTRKMHDCHLINGKLDNRLGFVLEGGSIESDGQGTILTTAECLLSPNRNGDLNRRQIEKYLEESLGAKRILWLDHGFLEGDDTDSHIDTLARIVPHDTIMYVKCDDPDDVHHEALSLMERQLMEMRTIDGRPYNLIGLPLPDPIYDEEGHRLPATYANFLITPTSVLLPVYGQPRKDKMARQMLEIVFHDRPVHTIDCRSLIKQHGSLHCMTMQIPGGVIQM